MTFRADPVGFKSRSVSIAEAPRFASSISNQGVLVRMPFAMRNGSPVPSPVQPEEARRAVSKAALSLSKDRRVITPHLDPQLPLALRDGATSRPSSGRLGNFVALRVRSS